MRIEQVTATGFGPLVERSLRLHEALTVVIGPNESAKSSWHAATYAAICGVRRGRGQPHERDRRFRERHKPWDAGPWRVSARLRLDDGRMIEISHELDDRVDCRAIDVGLNRDVSNEIMNDGTVDASRWLGLGRRAFEATACIRQGDLAAVGDAGGVLRELLDRVAATGPTDESTARALELLADFQREAVGVDRAGAVRPLRRAREEYDRLVRARTDAVRTRAEFDARARRVQGLVDEAAKAQRASDLAATAVLRAQADTMRVRLDRAESIVAEFGSAGPAAEESAVDVVAEVSSAVTRRRERPTIPEVVGNPEALRSHLAALPDPPTDETSVAPAVAVARGSYESAVAALREHDARADAGDPPAISGGSPEELRDLATRFEEMAASPAATDRPMTDRPTTSGTSTGRTMRWLGPTLLAAGIVLVVLGLTLGLIDAKAWLLAGLLFGGIAIWLGFATMRRVRAGGLVAAGGPPSDANRVERRAALEEQAARFGVAPDPRSLRAAAATVAEQQAAADRHARWLERHADLSTRVATAGAGLRGALRQRGIAIDPNTPDLDQAYAAYEARCAEASRTARAAQQRIRIAHDLERAEQSLAQREAARAAVERAAADVHAAARRAGIDCAGVVDPGSGVGDHTPECFAALEAWLESQGARSSERRRAESAWREYDQIVGAGDLDDLRRQAQAADEAATHAAIACGARAADLDASGATSSPAALADAAAQANQRALSEQSRLAEAALGLPDLAQIEDDLALAKAERERVQDLQEVLDRTVEFMRAAQDRVHRSIAPRLQESLTRWLPAITEGRYSDAIVDPSTLAVRVRGHLRPWRDASLLSYGTAEQIYLLLRLALVEHLTTGHDTCPLLLDDVTVHADSARTRAVLELLHTVSHERQVVLFTQEDAVATWARERLADQPGAIVDLADVAPA